MATPFRNKQFTFTQPDGSTLEVRGTGDQHYAVFETLDGFTLVKNPDTDFYEIARVSDDGSRLEPAGVAAANTAGARATVRPGIRIDPQAARASGEEGARRMGGRRCDQRRAEQRTMARMAFAADGAVFAPPRRDTVGDFVGLCLLIDFSDEVGVITPAQVTDFCNTPGYTGFGNSGSVNDFFRANSINRCRYTNIVTPYYRAQHPKTYYTNPNIADGVRARELIVEALNHWKANNFDFSGLTVDDEGYVYAMNVYYAGRVVNNWGKGLWPHAWHLQTPVQLMAGRRAFDYQFTDMSNELTLGTFCHENGHMLCDYPDLYDYGYESSGVGAFCLMCAGNNADEKNPPHISAYLKRKSGWANTVSPIGHDQTITLPAGTNDFAIHVKSGREYFLLENRARAGRDAALPDEGLAIWHVDEDGDNSNEHRTPEKHYELSLVQADGNYHLETSRNHMGDATDLYGRTNKRFADGTAPGSRWWNGTSSHLDVHEISTPGSSVTFKTRLHSHVANPQALRRESSPAAAIPDNQAAGISDTITFTESATIGSVAVILDITHTYRGDLQATLMTPWGASIVLQPRNQGGSADNIKRTILEADLPALASLRGRGVTGPWRLTVQDLAPADTGVLNKWALEFATTGQAPGEVVLAEAPGVQIPDNNASGVERALVTNAGGTVGRVEVSVNISHSYIGDLRVGLRSPAGTEVILHDRSGSSGDNLVKTYTPATKPELATLAGQTIAGAWKLFASDRDAQDIGKLNDWRVAIRPA